MESVTELLLTRHAPVAVTGLCYGRSNVPTAMDVESAVKRVLAEPLLGGAGRPIDGVYASPSVRCYELAAALSSQLGLQCHEDARLQELDFGQWEQMPYDEIYRIDRQQFTQWAQQPMGHAPPGGESGASMARRVAAWLRQIRGTRALVVTHAGTIRILRALVVQSKWVSIGPGDGLESLELDFTRPVVPLALERLIF